MLKKSVMCACTALAVLLVAALPAGAGSLAGYANAKIPFDFVVSGRTMPAGDYSFEMVRGQPLVAVRGADGRKGLGFMRRRVPADSRPRATRTRCEERGDAAGSLRVRSDGPEADASRARRLPSLSKLGSRPA